jgi:predicted trehalose synthase
MSVCAVCRCKVDEYIERISACNWSLIGHELQVCFLRRAVYEIIRKRGTRPSYRRIPRVFDINDS